MRVLFEVEGYSWLAKCVSHGRVGALYVRVPLEVVDQVGLVSGMECNLRALPRGEKSEASSPATEAAA